MIRNIQHRLVSTTTWSFFVLYARILIVSRGVVAQNNNITSSSSSNYPGCSGYVPHIGDSICDEQNNNAECGYDGGDCCLCTCVDSPTESCGNGTGFNCTDPSVPDDCGETPSPAAAFGFPNCTGYILDLGNELCDDDLNNEECGYDGGDCCRCTCTSTGDYDSCGDNGYDCLDPDAPTDCESASPTPSPTAALGYPNCTGDMNLFQNGYCSWSLNNEECGYDGGDCCSCTCEDGIYYTCGTYGYDCLDPYANCSTPSPTLTPVAALGYPNCTGDMNLFQTGYCSWSLNNEECGYDGGDCCRCTCEDGMYTCGSGGFDCKDPIAPTDCPTPSPTPSPVAGLRYPDCTGDISDLQNGRCDWDLNNEECGYDGGDCCECSCTDTNGDYACGEYGYSCLNPDPCPSAEKSSEYAIPVSAIIAITCLSAVCAGCAVVSCMRMKRLARSARSGATTNSAPLPPPPAYWTTAYPLQRVSSRTTNKPAAQQLTVVQPVGPAGPSHHQRLAVQNGRQPRVVMPWKKRASRGHSRVVTGTGAYPQPSAPPAPLQPDSSDPRPRGATFARIPTFSSAPVLEGSVLEGSINRVATGHYPSSPDVDAIEVERIRLAVAASRRVQTISEAMVWQEMYLPQPDASTAVVTSSGSRPSGVSIVEEKDPSNAEEKDNGQYVSSESEWGSDDDEVKTEHEEPQDDSEHSAGVVQLTGTGEVGVDLDGKQEIEGPTGIP